MKRVNVINLHHKMRNISKAENVQFDITVEDLTHLMEDVGDKEQFAIKLKDWQEGYTAANIEIRKL